MPAARLIFLETLASTPASACACRNNLTPPRSMPLRNSITTSFNESMPDLDARSAFDLLRNTRQHASVRVRLQEQFDATKVNALKKFHHDFFDRANARSRCPQRV